MESIYTELALNASKYECARTDNVFSTISEVCDGTVSIECLICKQINQYACCIPGAPWYFTCAPHYLLPNILLFKLSNYLVLIYHAP